MNKSSENRFGHNLHASPWIIVGSVVILLITVVVLAVQNHNREKQYMSRILNEKGAALIKAIEAGTRTGMMGMMWGGKQIQTLIEETALLQDVLYITITDIHGLVLASSRSASIGTQLRDSPSLEGIDPSDKVNWRIISLDNQRRSFEVYRNFRPISNRDDWMNNRMRQMMGRHGMMMGTDNDWCFPSGKTDDENVILIGLDPEPFEDARKEDVRNTVIISGVLVVLGLAGFISMFWMQSYRSTKKSLQDTSAIADEVVRSLPVGLIATDRDGRVAFYNSTAERITGLNLFDARGKDPETILPSYFCGLKKMLDQGESIFEKEMECEFVKDTIVPVSVSASKIINEEGQFVGQVLILRDLGEVRRLQDEVRRKEKLAAIGGLAAGVAHEIRNPLSSIKGIASYFKNKFDEDSGDKEMAGVMIEEVDRMNRVISELLEFARPTDLNLKRSDVNSLIEHSVRLIEKEAHTKDISIKLYLTKQPLTTEIDSDRFSQCLLNLYLNALQAMEKGGQLSIKNSLSDDSLIVIEIGDTGSGIEAQNMHKIFDPYYTTKTKGTGLGLAIVHKIIEAHNGSVKVRSAPDQGTTFTISIPAKKL
ncbi:PAS domain-containing sensor histidine kinase [Desulfosarcina widdelii]|uniref:histidine kinase n=1 Tax=Desulfosarcina widdelii TaxID=947919 RepID=A0A5K7ZCB5_9BACT|nr:ATP-binding protein [Desulfosarcina widdelii]BBO77371.1 PAS domain-containing sensor histidine kinase [Desulfosarcina widdelii]